MQDSYSTSTQPSEPHCFRSEPPFHFSKKYAMEYRCDVAVTNGDGSGIGNVIAYTRLIEELSLKMGRRIKLLTAPMRPKVGVVDEERPYPVWENNPFIDSILNADEIDPQIIRLINQEKTNHCQFNHVIENICFDYGVRPRSLRPSLFLSSAEQAWALDQIAHIKRPVVCLHRGGTTSCRTDSGWSFVNWQQLLQACKHRCGFFEIGLIEQDTRSLGIFSKKTHVRQMMGLIWASDLFIGFDSAPMHVAAAFEKPSIILWDAIRKLEAEERCQRGFAPAVILRWGYPQHRNVMILGDRNDETLRVVIDYILQTCRSLYYELE